MLYKFVGSRQAVCAIASGLLKFTKPNELNDPSELIPLMNRDTVRESLIAVRRNKYTDEQFKWLGYQESILNLLSPETRATYRPATRELANLQLALPIYDNIDLMERQLLQTIRLIRNRVGILSLTARYDSLPMWAHYSDQAKGYVLCFENLDREFPGDATGSLHALKPVQYVENLVGMTHDPTTQDNLFFCKFQDWAYEREWRVVSALSACNFNAQKNIYLRSIKQENVVGVICGWNTPSEEKSTLTDELNRINPRLSIRIASLDRGRVVVGGI